MLLDPDPHTIGGADQGPISASKRYRRDSKHRRRTGLPEYLLCLDVSAEELTGGSRVLAAGPGGVPSVSSQRSTSRAKPDANHPQISQVIGYWLKWRDVGCL